MAKTSKAATKAPAFKLITDTAAIDKESKSLVTSIGNLDKRIQVYLMSEIAHIAQHHNTTRLNQFFENIAGKGARVQAMAEFVQRVGTLTYNEESKKFQEDRNKTLNLELAATKMWTEYKPEGKITAFSLNAAVAKLIEQALKLAAAPREGVEDTIQNTTLDALLKVAESNGIAYEVPKSKAIKAIPAEAVVEEGEKVGAAA